MTTKKHEEKASKETVKLGPVILEIPEAKLNEVGSPKQVAEILGMTCRGCTIVSGVARVELDH